MSIRVVIYQKTFSNEDKILLNKILKAADINDYEIINSFYYNIDKNISTTVITFGLPITHQISQALITFPSLEFLHDLPKNKIYREQAFKLVEILKIKLSISKITDIKSLPVNSIEELLIINKYAIENNLDKIELIDLNNNKISILFNSNDKVIGKYILFSELIAIKLAMQIFNIKNIG